MSPASATLETIFARFLASLFDFLPASQVTVHLIPRLSHVEQLVEGLLWLIRTVNGKSQAFFDDRH
jgi:hypothetical protein